MILGHLIEASEILLVLIISMTNAGGEQIDVILVLTDGTTPRDCNNGTACYFHDNNSIWIRYDKMDRLDRCGRDVLMHEFLHAKYEGFRTEKEVHEKCYLSQRMFITDIKVNRSWSTTI